VDLIEIYRKSVAEMDERVDAVTADQWDQQTKCCPDWTVRDLLNHVVYENVWVPPLMEGQTIEQVGSRFEGDLLGSDPAGSWKTAANEVISSIAQEGALDRTVQLSSGETPSTHYIAEVLSDQIVHTWDLATSIGADPTLDPELVEFARATLEPLAEMWRAGGALGPPVETSPDADDQTRLLALLGRKA